MYEYSQAYGVFEYREMNMHFFLLLMRRLTVIGGLRFISPGHARVCFFLTLVLMALRLKVELHMNEMRASRTELSDHSMHHARRIAFLYSTPTHHAVSK